MRQRHSSPSNKIAHWTKRNLLCSKIIANYQSSLMIFGHIIRFLPIRQFEPTYINGALPDRMVRAWDRSDLASGSASCEPTVGSHAVPCASKKARLSVLFSGAGGGIRTHVPREG